MNINTSDRRQLEQSSNVLLLAPLTPTGNRACLELLAAVEPPARTNVAAVTYTPPPETWVANWREHVGMLPAELAFIHANTVETRPDGEDSLPERVSVGRVDPNQPMDIIAPLSEQLTRWQDNGNQTVVSVQTLTVLLEYVDFDTAFRYLHILTHRVGAVDAIGVYHMDPDVHDEKTINTLETLFDAVVEVSPDGEEWSVTETYGDRTATSDHTQNHDTDVEIDDTDGGVFDAIRDSLSSLFSGGDAAASNGENSTQRPTTDGPASPSDSPAGNAVDDVPNDAMLTDEDRIRELLTSYGGRMKQTDVTEETDWSKSTVSRKLSKMEDKGLITRVQVGRGNLVFLSGYEPETAKSPFETESS
ncbi:DUF7504 family protein [Halorussus marinus]|uniref:DUF7504 family protein n=1 Tax=Halorussus marinus TaxID=2505976 RepID=UPI00106EB7AA|nr:MarR family transcriptional regulator [Halorussus marinus]